MRSIPVKGLHIPLGRDIPYLYLVLGYSDLSFCCIVDL